MTPAEYYDILVASDGNEKNADFGLIFAGMLEHPDLYDTWLAYLRNEKPMPPRPEKIQYLFWDNGDHHHRLKFWTDAEALAYRDRIIPTYSVWKDIK